MDPIPDTCRGSVQIERTIHFAGQGDHVYKQFDHDRGVRLSGKGAAAGVPCASGTTASTTVDHKNGELTRGAA
jgi:hypothetical protein